MTLAAIIVGAETVFMAADSRMSDAVTGEALDAPVRKLHDLDGPLAAVSAGFGPTISRDLLPMVDMTMKAQEVSGDLEFVETWVRVFGMPIYLLGRTLWRAVGKDPDDGNLIVAFGGVGEAGPEVRVHRFDTLKTEIMGPGMIAAFGSDTPAMQEAAQALAERHFTGNQIQADLWAFELCMAAADALPASVAFPLDLMIVDRDGGVTSRIETPARRLETRPEFLVRF